MRDLIKSIKILLRFFEGDIDKVHAWLEHYNPSLGASPILLFDNGRGHKVLEFIQTQFEENYEGRTKTLKGT